MATDYPSLKVPDLKKLLQERGLAVSGNKAELISRLQQDDKKIGSNTREDEIDWEEDDKVASTSLASGLNSTPAAPANAQESNGNLNSSKPEISAIKNQLTKSEEVSKTTDKTQSSVISGNPNGDFTLGLGQSDSIIEAEKRAARAKRFGRPQSEESIKMAERAKKFRLPSSKDEVVQSLDTALPEHKPKRTRDEKDKPIGRPEKRHVNDRKNESRTRNNNYYSGLNKMKISAILDDPSERAKAEARAKRFARPIVS